MTTRSSRIGLAVVVAVAVLGCAKADRVDPATSAPPIERTPEAVRSAAPFLGMHYPTQGHTHLTPGEPDDFVYNSNPPTSGPHREIFVDALINTKPIPSYVQVHLLEHGNVLLQYNCACPDVAAALGRIAMSANKPHMKEGERLPTVAEAQNLEENGAAVMVAPYPRMKSRIAASAWTHLATFSAVDRPKIESFIKAHLMNPSD